MYFNRPMPKKGETYKHFKDGVYEIIALAVSTEPDYQKDKVFLVIYKPVAGSDSDTFARPLKEFLGAAMAADGKPVLRFAKVQPKAPPGQMTLHEAIARAPYETR